VQAAKKLDLWRLPELLVVLVKRFEHARGGRVKLDAPVAFPLAGLDLAPYVAHAQARPWCHDDQLQTPVLPALVMVARALGAFPFLSMVVMRFASAHQETCGQYGAHGFVCASG